LFLIIVAVAHCVNKNIDNRDFKRFEMMRLQDENIQMDSTRDDDMHNIDAVIEETIEVDLDDNKVNGVVKENLNSSGNVTFSRVNKRKKEPLENFDNDYYFGKLSAPITIVEYSSYTCPNCIVFYDNTMNNLKSEYIDTGKVRYVKRMIVQKDTLLGVMLPYCAPEKNRYALVRELYASVNNWLSPSRQKSALEGIALRNGFTKETFEACIKDSKLGNELLKKQQRDIKDLKIMYTPTIFINEEKQSGAIPYDKLKERIDKELKKIEAVRSENN
jgi:hypothetical protein